MNLIAHLLSETALLNSALTPGGGASGNGYSIAANHPRILFNNTAFSNRMADAASSNIPAYARIKNICDTRFKVTGTLRTKYYDALMYQITKDEGYATYAYNEVMAFLVAEETRIANQTPTSVEFDSYLYIGPTFYEIMLSYDWCSHKFSESERQRLFAYVNQGLDNIVSPGTAKWGSRNAPWSGWSVNAPTNNYFNSRFLAFTVVTLGSFGDNERAAEWLSYMIDDRIPFMISDLSTMLPDGGSLEGTNYGMSLGTYWLAFYVWQVSTGFSFFNENDFTRGSLYWFIHNLSPDGKYFLASGDQSRDATGLYMDYGRANFLGLMALYPSDIGARATKSLLSSIGSTQMQFSSNADADLLTPDTDVIAAPISSLSTQYMNLKGGLTSIRTGWGAGASWLTQQVGVMYESHQHMVNGAFEIFKGEWLFDTHSRRSFNGLLAHPAANNNSRFDLNAGVDAEGLPTSTIMESGTVRVGTAYPTYYPIWTAYYNDDAVWYTEANLRDAFWDRAEIVKNRRGLLVLKNPNSQNFTVISFDEMQSATAGTHKVFQLNMGYAPTVSGETFTINNGMTQAKVFAADDSGAAWSLVNLPVSGLSARAGYRMERRVSGTTRANLMNVVDVGLEVTSVVASNGPASKDATITFNDGRSAVVSFNSANPGGSLTYTSSTGQTLYSGALPSTVNNYGYLA